MAAPSAAMIRYGLAVASPSLTSIRAAEPRSGGTRTIALRLSRPQSISHGASVSGPNRLGVDGGVEQRAQGRCVREDPADGVPADGGQAVGPARITEYVPPGLVVHRDVHVETGPALVVERLGHEGGQQAVLAGDLLHGRLEPEGPVGRVDQPGMAEVDLELAGRELVVGRRDLQPGVAQLPEHVQ